MANYQVRYVSYRRGNRRTRAAAITEIGDISFEGTSSAGFVIGYPVNPVLVHDGQTYRYLFTSVVGSASGAYIDTDSGDSSPAVIAGAADVIVTVFYVPVGGGGDENPGMVVDAFNINTGTFSNSDFVTVSIDGEANSVETETANRDGWVSSDRDKSIRAFSSVDGYPFKQWQLLGEFDTESLETPLPQGKSGYQFAFYYRENVEIGRPDVPEQGWVFVSPGVKVDGGGFVIGPGGEPIPVGPWGAWTMRLMTAVTLMSIAENMDANLKSQAYNLAAAHLNSAAQKVKALGKMGKK